MKAGDRRLHAVDFCGPANVQKEEESVEHDATTKTVDKKEEQKGFGNCISCVQPRGCRNRPIERFKGPYSKDRLPHG
jgi:hypothetical protein